MIQRVKHLLTVHRLAHQRQALRIRHLHLHLPRPHLHRSPRHPCSRTRTRLRHRRRLFHRILLSHLLHQLLRHLPRRHNRRPPFAMPRLSNKPLDLHRAISHFPCPPSRQQLRPSSPPPLRNNHRKDLGVQVHIIGGQIRQLDLDRSLLHMDTVSRLISTCTNLMDGGKIRLVKQLATCFEVACSIIDTSSCLI